MIRPISASLAFLRDAPTKKTSFGTQVIEALTENAATFPNLPVTISDLTLMNSNLIEAVNAAATGEHVAEANLKLQVSDWNSAFKRTANYVSNIADGVEATIRKGGFVNTKGETTPAQKPGMPVNFVATSNGTKGNICAGCNPVFAAKALVFTALPEGASVSFNGDVMLITVGNTTVQVLVTTKRKAVFSNIASGTAMDLSVYAINAAGSGTSANGQNIIAQ